MLPHPIGYYLRIGQCIGRRKSRNLNQTFFVVNKKKRTWFQRKSGSFWWRLLDSNQWPPACEDTSGRQSPAIGCFPALLASLSVGTNHCLVHCVHPLIFWYWSAYWSKPRLRQTRRSRGFDLRTNLVAVIVAWTGTIVKYIFPPQATCSAPPLLHQMVGKYMNKTNDNKNTQQAQKRYLHVYNSGEIVVHVRSLW